MNRARTPNTPRRPRRMRRRGTSPTPDRSHRNRRARARSSRQARSSRDVHVVVAAPGIDRSFAGHERRRERPLGSVEPLPDVRVAGRGCLEGQHGSGSSGGWGHTSQALRSQGELARPVHVPLLLSDPDVVRQRGRIAQLQCDLAEVLRGSRVAVAPELGRDVPRSDRDDIAERGVQARDEHVPALPVTRGQEVSRVQ